MTRPPPARRYCGSWYWLSVSSGGGKAFRELARRYHPDSSTEPDAEQRFREIAEAYGVLSDPARRASYDTRGFAGLTGAGTEDLWGDIDFADIFGPGSTGPGGLFERLFERPEAGPPRGGDLRVDLLLSLDQVLAGGKQVVSISRPAPCPDCGSSGASPGTRPRSCPDCGGTGRRATASRRAGVPWHRPGSQAGRGHGPHPARHPGRSRAAHRGQGPASLPRAQPGDLNVTVIADIPQQLSPRQRGLYEQLRAEDSQPADSSALSA